MESTQVLECTQVLESHSGYAEERIETPVKVATLTIEGVDHVIWNRENTIGRDAKCTIVLNNKAVSVEHAVIEADLQGGHFICDLGSTNKTKLGDLQLKPRVKYFIKDGDSLKIANAKGVYRYLSSVTNPTPPKPSTPPVAELTAIPGTPERKEEEDAVASIVAETPCKDENEGVSSDGDIFGDVLDSSALFVRPLKISSDVSKSPVECRLNSAALLKSGDKEKVGCALLGDPVKDASVYAVASQSTTGDQSSVSKGHDGIDESSVCEADSSDLVAGSQPMFTPKKQLHSPNVFDCDTEPPGSPNINDELTKTPKECQQWENIDDSIDEISVQMDTIDSLVENNKLQVTCTPPKRKIDVREFQEVDPSGKPKNLTDSPHSTKSDAKAESPSSSSPNVKKFNKNRIGKHFEEGLDVSANNGDAIKSDHSESGRKSEDSVVSLNDASCVTVYKLTSEGQAGDSSIMKSDGVVETDTSLEESSDLVLGSQPIGTTEKSGKEHDIFEAETMPMECGLTGQGSPKINIFDLATQQVHNQIDVEEDATADSSNIFDIATQPFVVPSNKINEREDRIPANEAKVDPASKVAEQEVTNISISDLPPRAVPGSVNPSHDSLVDKKQVPAENLVMQECEVSISDMATQAVSAVKINRETSPIHETSISDMPTQVVQKNQNEDCFSKLTEGDVSFSDMATQQVPLHRDAPKEVVSAPHPTNSSVQLSRLTCKSKIVVRSASGETESKLHQDSEDIYNVMTQLPVESGRIILEESNTQLINSDLQKASSHDVSISDMLTQPSKNKPDGTGGMHVVDVSLSELATQVAVANYKLNPAESSERMMDQDTEDIFNAMTQLPVHHDKILTDTPNTHLLNSEVEKATLDVSISDMMTQPSKLTSGVTRESPVDVILELPTQASAAKVDSIVHENSEDIYNVMTQIPVENEKIVLDESDTQQINADLENSDMKLVNSAMKHVSEGKKLNDGVSSDKMGEQESKKNNEFQFKKPTPAKGLVKYENKKRDVDIFMVDTQPLDSTASGNSNLTDVGVAINHEELDKSLAKVVSHCEESALDASISELATQDAANVPLLPIHPINAKDVNDDIFELDTAPLTDPTKTAHDTHEVVSESSGKETVSRSCEQPVPHGSQEIDSNSVEDRIRALSDKNENSIATQQILISSNVKSTVAELLETLEDTGSQVVRTNKKVKKLDYSDSEDSNNSPVVRVHRRVKTLAESDNEEETDSPLIAPKKPCRPLSDTQEGEEESLENELKKGTNKTEARSDIVCNGNVKRSSKLSLKNPINVITTSPVPDSPKNIISEPLKENVSSDTVKGHKGAAGSVPKSSTDSEIIKVSAERLDMGQTAGIENETCKPASSKVTKDLTHKKDEKSDIGKSSVNNTADSGSLQLQLSANESLNKSSAVAVPTTPEKQTVSTEPSVTPSTHELAKASPETPEIPTDFFGTPILHEKPVRQYVNRKKLSLSSTSLLKGPNASSTPKSDIDSHSIIEMEESLLSAKASSVKIRKVDEKGVNQKTVGDGHNTPTNVKNFKKASPQKRKSLDAVEQQSQECDFLSSQESLDSQEFGRGKRKKLKKSFFGFDDNEELDLFTIKSSSKDLESVQDAQQFERQTSSAMRSAEIVSPANVQKIISSDSARKDKNTNVEAPVKRQGDSRPISLDSSSLKKVKLSSEIEGENRLSNQDSDDMEMTCVPSSSLEKDVGGTVVNVKKFRRSSPKKDPVSLDELANSEHDVKPVQSNVPLKTYQRRRQNTSTAESESEKGTPHINKTDSSVSAGNCGVVLPSTSTKSLRARKRDIKEHSKSEPEPTFSSEKLKRNRVPNMAMSSQEISDTAKKSDSSQELSIKSMSKRLQEVMKNDMKREEGENQQVNERGRDLRKSGGDHSRTQEDVRVGDRSVEEKPLQPNLSVSAEKKRGRKFRASEEILDASSNTLEEPATSQVTSQKKEVKRRGRPRKVENQAEQTLKKSEVAEKLISDAEESKSNTAVTVRRGRRKFVHTEEDSDPSGTQPPASSQEVSATKRGRKADTGIPVNASKEAVASKSEVTKMSDSQSAPSTSKSSTDVSKSRGRGRVAAIIEDSSAFETDQDSQSQDLSQGRRSARARKKKESFDEIMSRKEEEIKMKKLQRTSEFSSSPDKSRSVSRASVASSSKTEDVSTVVNKPRRRGRPRKSASVTSTPTVLSADEDSAFSVPASIPVSPAADDSSRRKVPRSGSASSNQVVATPKTKQQIQKSSSSPTMKVMFTGLADAKLSAMVKKLGGKVVEKPADCSVLVTDKVRRTVKFLCALGLGKPIVSPNWLSKSKAFNEFADPNDSLLKDSESEGKFDFQLNKSLATARESRLLEGYSFYATPSVLPPPAEIKPIVECCGGTYMAKPPAKWPPNSAIISSPKDKSGWTKLSKHGVLPPILSAEALLSGVLQQRFDLGKHRLK